MSIRVHDLAKRIGIPNQDLIQLLKERNYDVRTASSSIDNISAEALVEEFEAKKTPDESPVASTSQDTAEESPALPETPKSALPTGAIVKTASQIEQEQREKEEAKKRPVVTPAEVRKPAVAQPTSTPPPAVMRAPSVGMPPRTPPPVAQQGFRPAPTPRPAPATSIPSVHPAKKEATPATTPPPAILRAPAQTQAPAPARAHVPTQAPAKTPAPARAPAPTPAPAPAPVPAPTPVPVHSDIQAKGPATPPPIGAPGVKMPERVASPAANPPPTPAAAPKQSDVKHTGEKRKLQIKPPIVVREFANRLEIRPFRLISILMELGIFASMNHTIDEEVAAKIADQHGFILDVKHRGEGTVTKETQTLSREKKITDDDPATLKDRPPVVCILGHVDHGKTTLLDTIRKTNVVSGEFGGITQHIGAYQITYKDRLITFLDTPGHAAFSKMRERGAEVTDIAILVVAADDGFMPQTDEALKFAKRSQVSIMVAINKIDSKGANIDRVKQQMQERGIASEDWGGETIAVPVSALKGDNIEQLMEMILLQAEVMELKANPDAEAQGVIIESQMEQGRGPTATVIVERGTLKTGDSLVCDTIYCKVRSMLDDNGKPVKVAPPSTPVKVIGWSDVPDAGMGFERVKNDKEAKRIAEDNIQEARKRELAEAEAMPARKTSIEDLFQAIESNQKKTLRCILKADVHGSVEAIRSSLEEIKSDKVALEILDAEVGPVSKNDVDRAATSKATVISFNIGTENGVRGLAKHHGVNLYQGNIIYELIDTVKELMSDLLEPELHEIHIGFAEIRQVFSVGKGTVAGCMITEGKINRDKPARLRRKGEIIAEARIDTLKRFKEDVTEVRTGFECGIRIANFDDYREGDQIECFDIEKRKPAL